jgi:hypothetical protein
MSHQTVIAFAQFKYTISNYLAIKDYHNILFHGYRLQFQLAGETNWPANCFDEDKAAQLKANANTARR